MELEPEKQFWHFVSLPFDLLENNVTLTTTPQVQIIFLWLILVTVFLSTKFEMSCIIHSRDIRGVPYFKMGHVTA